MAKHSTKPASDNRFDPLRDYLLREKRDDFVLTFEEIEDILGFALPRSAQRAEWWEDDTPEHPRLQRIAIRDGGFSSRRAGEGRVRFRRSAASSH